MWCESILSKRVLLTAVGLVMTALMSAAPAFADSPAELLEKAIYIEETVGDLDKAIDGYRQVLSASEQAIDAAAEAQYRIGACLAKQGKTDEAATAFQAVADSYGASKNWVKQAKEQLSSLNALQPVPWGDGDEMHMRMKLPGGLDAGYQVFRVAKTQIDGHYRWECQNWQTVTLNEAAGKSRVVADFDSFAAVESQWTHSMLGKADGKYSTNEVVITVAGKDEPKTLELEPMTYDNEQAAQVFRRLPLAKGYQGKINVISTLVHTKVPIELEVNEVETIEVPAGKFDCFKLELSIGQTFWISTGAKREIVRFEGGGVEANLVEVRATDVEPATIGGDKFSLTLPAGWHAFESDDITFLVDPGNSMRSRVAYMKAAKVREKFDSPKSAMKDKVAKAKKAYKNVSATDDAVRTTTIAGHDAAVVGFEFDGNKAQQSVHQVLVFGNGYGVDLKFVMPADEREAKMPQIEKLIKSLKLE